MTALDHHLGFLGPWQEPALTAGLDLLQAPFELCLGEVALPVVHRLALAAIDGQHRLRAQLQTPAQVNELRADLADRTPNGAFQARR